MKLQGSTKLWKSMKRKELQQMEDNVKAKEPRAPKLYEAIATFLGLVVIMSVGIVVFEVSPHIPNVHWRYLCITYGTKTWIQVGCSRKHDDHRYLTCDAGYF